MDEGTGTGDLGDEYEYEDFDELRPDELRPDELRPDELRPDEL